MKFKFKSFCIFSKSLVLRNNLKSFKINDFGKKFKDDSSKENLTLLYITLLCNKSFDYIPLVWTQKPMPQKLAQMGQIRIEVF
jgi:hypothetical protein